ncbi:MAG: phenylalanine--tRNA ligase subunit beta, partial [Erysipelothrix sp.]|nr:phenylalanine--tRNA ligase subunit beta [Erysipelothrix sp.]
AGRLLKDINVFDVFTSKDLDNKKSIAIEVVLGADHTLSEEEIQNTMNKITNNLETNLNVTIR